MGDNPASQRNYKREYANFKKDPQNMKEHSERVKARRAMVREYGKEALAGKDIDHRDPLRQGGGNTRGNWRIESVHDNRDWRKGKHGYDR